MMLILYLLLIRFYRTKWTKLVPAKVYGQYIYIYVQGDTPTPTLISMSIMCIYIYMIGQYWNKQQLSKSSGGSGNGILIAC